MCPQRITAVYRESGLFAVLAKVARKVRAAFYVRHKDIVVARDLRSVRPAPTDRLDFQAIGPEHAPSLVRFAAEHGGRRSARKLTNYLRNGYEGFVATRDGEIVAYLWWIDGRVEPRLNHPHALRYALELDAKEAYVFDFFIASQHRAGGSAVELIFKAQAELARLGYERYWAIVAAANAPARWVSDVTGFQPARHVIGHEVFSWLLFARGRLYLKNYRWNANCFDYRPLR